ncbi:MAG TPA: oligosaccharide flippase family protein [Pyrinomonadaceae bacterium]|nr:oligosaccharide flippase family protein [Pyrinomonadaceae bacterium]
MQTSLTSRVQSGVFWNTLSVSSTYLAGLIRSIVVARLLMPDDFGLIGMALTVVAGLNALTSIGVEIPVIKRKFKSDEELATHLNTIWTVDLIRRTILAILLALLAYPVAKFYREVRLYEILLLFSLLPLIQGLQNIGLLIYRKQLKFRRIVWLELTTNFLTVTTTIALVVWTRNVWALVLSQLAAAVIGVVLSYLFHPFRPRLAFDKDVFSLILSFGKYAVLLGTLGYIMQMADNILIGRLFNAAVLGTYVIAYNLATLPIHGLVSVIGSVTFPAYAEISSGANVIEGSIPMTPWFGRKLPTLPASKDSKRLEQAFVRVFAISSLVLALTTALLMLLGDEIVILLYGTKWAAAGTILRILSLLVFCRGCSVLVSPLLVSIRGIQPDAKVKLVEVGIFLALLYPLTSSFGALGAAWAGAIAFFVTMINRLYFAGTLLPGIAKTIRRTIFCSVMATATGVALGALAIVKIENITSRLLLGGSAIAIVVTGVLLLLLPELRTEGERLFATVKKRTA